MINNKFSSIKTSINDVLILEPTLLRDQHGWFFESFNDQNFLQITNSNLKFVQDNHSQSQKGSLRGLHYQLERAQGKLIRVSKGSIFDVVVDLRRDSTTFGKWFGIELSDQNHRQLWVPPGLAHGFLVISDVAETLYKVTEHYYPDDELSILWSDPKLAINWPIKGNILITTSVKDAAGLSWDEAPKY